MQKTPLVAIVIVLALAAPATAAAPPQVVKLRKQVAALNAKVKRLTVERNAALRQVTALNAQVGSLDAQVAALKAQLTPKPSESVKVANGENGDHAKITGASVTKDGDVLGQIEYLGGLTCPDLGPYLNVDATFFDATGAIVNTGSDVESSVVVGPRYPLKIFGAAGAVRADVVVSIICI
jgi:hypothetical protein